MTAAMLGLSDALAVSFSMSEATMMTSCMSSFAAAISLSVKPFAAIFSARFAFSASTASYISSVTLLSKRRRNLSSTLTGSSPT